MFRDDQIGNKYVNIIAINEKTNRESCFLIKNRCLPSMFLGFLSLLPLNCPIDKVYQNADRKLLNPAH